MVARIGLDSATVLPENAPRPVGTGCTDIGRQAGATDNPQRPSRRLAHRQEPDNAEERTAWEKCIGSMAHSRDLDGSIYRFHDANGRGRHSVGSNN